MELNPGKQQPFNPMAITNNAILKLELHSEKITPIIHRAGPYRAMCEQQFKITTNIITFSIPIELLTFLITVTETLSLSLILSLI